MGKRQKLKKEVVLRCVLEGGNLHESAKVYLSQRGVNESGGCTSDLIRKLQNFLFFLCMTL